MVCWAGCHRWSVTVHPYVWMGHHAFVYSVSTPQFTVQILLPRQLESTHLPARHRPRCPEHPCVYLGAGKGFYPISTLPPSPPFDLLGAALRGILMAVGSRTLSPPHLPGKSSSLPQSTGACSLRTPLTSSTPLGPPPLDPLSPDPLLLFQCLSLLSSHYARTLSLC